MLRATPASCGEGGSSGPVSIGAIHCDGAMKNNGTTSKGTTRWRCTTCKSLLNPHHPVVRSPGSDVPNVHRLGHQQKPLTKLAADTGTRISTLRRRFTWCWYIQVPHTPDPHRIHDQIFIDWPSPQIVDR